MTVTHRNQAQPDDLFPHYKPLSRQAWVSACEFHDLTERQVLEEVSRRVKELKARATSERSSHPLVLLDLDGTLYEVGCRTDQILQEWVASSESAAYPKVRAALKRLESHHVGYSLKDTFAALELSLDDPEVETAWKAAKEFWGDRFFSSEYLKHDRPYEGAVDFVRELHALGAELVYLTGRDAPGMGEGTRKRLLQDGFPWDVERTHLLLKEASAIADVAHKQNASTYIKRHGTLIASFENEPHNLVALREIFPEAMHVFVESTCSEKSAMPCKGLYRIRGFR